jgi:hypothetical protein
VQSANDQIRDFAAGLEIAEDKLPKMICGCKLKKGKRITLDDHGFVVCPDHYMRRFGWRSVPYQATKVPPIPGAAAWSELQYERYILFGILPGSGAELLLDDRVEADRDIA